MTWKLVYRPGILGTKRNKVVSSWNETYGKDHWKLIWRAPGLFTEAFGVYEWFEFADACKNFYEKSYIEFFKKNPEQLDYVCQFGECIDNAATNTASGLDYMVQESKSTHIQDIAIRASLKALGRIFEGPKDRLLVVRGSSENGGHLSPGVVPFFNPRLIEVPSKAPTWASKGSVEDFWQSNKWLAVKEG